MVKLSNWYITVIWATMKIVVNGAEGKTERNRYIKNIKNIEANSNGLVLTVGKGFKYFLPFSEISYKLTSTDHTIDMISGENTNKFLLLFLEIFLILKKEKKNIVNELLNDYSFMQVNNIVRNLSNVYLSDLQYKYNEFDVLSSFDFTVKAYIEKVRSMIENLNLENNSIQINFFSPDKIALDVFSKFDDKIIYDDSIYVHNGMFQDSILIGRKKFDFRYFPMIDHLEIYHWSDGLEKVYINNLANIDMIIKWGKDITCKGNSITLLKYDQDTSNRCEGLISPDFVTGKSMLSLNIFNDNSKK